ncbi:MAG: phenylalanine 4-monooxygenase, partial [Myxococcota bacterium]
MGFESAYASKEANDQGFFHYSEEENSVWRDLIERQDKLLHGRAIPEVIRGLERLDLPRDRAPQVKEVDACLSRVSGFGVEAVPAMISEEAFFDLLVNRKFPVATFVRRREELDYLQEPDIFHEVYGHCPLLTNLDYANTVMRFGEAAKALGPTYFEPLYRLFWFTVEFGLVNTPEGRRIYGAGITSSAEETVFCLEDKQVQYLRFDPVEICATDYRIDVLQARYYVLDTMEDLHRLGASLIDELPRWC